MDRTVNIASGIVQIGVFAVVLWVALRRFAKTRSYWQLILTAWAWLIFWSLVICVEVPLLLSRLLKY